MQSLIGLSESLVVDFKSRMEGWDENQTKIGDVFMSMVFKFAATCTHTPIFGVCGCAPLNPQKQLFSDSF